MRHIHLDFSRFSTLSSCHTSTRVHCVFLFLTSSFSFCQHDLCVCRFCFDIHRKTHSYTSSVCDDLFTPNSNWNDALRLCVAASDIVSNSGFVYHKRFCNDFSRNLVVLSRFEDYLIVKTNARTRETDCLEAH